MPSIGEEEDDRDLVGKQSVFALRNREADQIRY